MRPFIVLGLLAALLMAGRPSHAAGLPTPQSIPCAVLVQVPLFGGGFFFTCAAGNAAGAAGATLGTMLVGGFVAGIAAVAAYDIYLKAAGYKNWDGTPKLVVIVRKHKRK
jgi:hypothetical protein